MRRRFICGLLAMILLIGVLPAGAVRVSAAEMKYSDDIIAFIKKWEGFSSKAFWDVSQWSIGYGTKGTAGQTITEEEAEAALKAELDAIDEKVNTFASSNGLSLSQNQHDAIVSLCFNCGTEWLKQSGRLRTAIVKGYTGNEFLFAISLWANISSVPDRGLLNRRLSEANLYLNGEYSKTVPSEYAYVIFDANGGTHGSGGEDKMQGYNASETAKIMVADPKKTGSVFGGWFTEPSGGTYVDVLNSATAGKTLYAQWGTQVKVKDPYVNVRNGAGTGYTQVGTLNQGDTAVIVQTTKVGDALWGRFSDGWIALEYTDYNGNTVSDSNEEAVASGTVSCSTYIYVRKGAGTNYPVSGSIVNGTKVQILETKSVSGVQWGRISSGWICLTYVKLDAADKPSQDDGQDAEEQEKQDEKDDSSYTAGTVTGNGVNVRTAAGVGNKIVTTLNKGTAVKVYEQITKDNAPWGRIDQGWICLNYVSLSASSENTNDSSEASGTALATGVVNSKTNLNVRSGAGTNYPSVRFLTPGTKVSIYEKTTVNGQLWGRIDEKNWICLAYVQLDQENTSAPDGTDAVIATGVVSSATGLNVRSGAGTGYSRVRMLTSGTKINIYEKKTVGGQEWGRIDEKNWVCLAYVKLDGSSSGSADNSDNDAAATGKVISKTNLNVRSAAGTGNAIVGSYAPGTSVTIYETMTVAGVKWGRTDKGWVSMNYIQITNSGSSAGASTDGVVWN